MLSPQYWLLWTKNQQKRVPEKSPFLRIIGCSRSCKVGGWLGISDYSSSPQSTPFSFAFSPLTFLSRQKEHILNVKQSWPWDYFFISVRWVGWGGLGWLDLLLKSGHCALSTLLPSIHSLSIDIYRIYRYIDINRFYIYLYIYRYIDINRFYIYLYIYRYTYQ